MFDSKTSLSDRFADSLDLAIDFATLGEYGLEPTGANPRTAHPCKGDRRTVRPQTPKRRERGPKASQQPSHAVRPTLRGQSDLWSQMTSHPSREGTARNSRLATKPNSTVRGARRCASGTLE